MIVDPQFRKCVTYLFIDKQDEESQEIRRIPVATAFFACVPILNHAFFSFYVITARHVIRSSRPYGSLFVRVNLKEGKYIDMEMPQDNWIEHPTTDVAVIPFLLPANFDIKYIPLETFASDEFITKQNVREGDDVFFCGMFQGYPGQSKMQPVIRFGNISLMPYEKIPLRESSTTEPIWVDAYLVEAKSWGGHSGSPAFLYLNPNRFPGQIVFQKGIPNFVLLGLVSGHFELPIDVDFLGDVVGSGTVNLNAGLASVIPSQKISEVLTGEECIEQRRKLEELIISQNPTMKFAK